MMDVIHSGFIMIRVRKGSSIVVTAILLGFIVNFCVSFSNNNSFGNGMFSTKNVKMQMKKSREPKKNFIHNNISKDVEWDVYVSMSKQCLSLGSAATLAAFKGLAPPDKVSVHSVPSLTVIKGQPGGGSVGVGPFVRCIQRSNNKNPIAIDINGCDSVGKVYRVLCEHMGLNQFINPSACECLTWNYRGNAYLDKASTMSITLFESDGGDNNMKLSHKSKSSTSGPSSDEINKNISLAIKAYTKALATGYKPQAGVLYVMRSTAYLQRAFEHRKKLKASIASLVTTVPENENTQQTMLGLVSQYPWTAEAVFERIREDTKLQNEMFRRLKFQHGLYEYALLHAAQDSLRATQILPQFAKTWLRAGDSLAELRKLRESTQYYEKALELDPSLEESLSPTIDRLKKSQRFLDKARANGWSEDTLQLSLDVAG